MIMRLATNLGDINFQLEEEQGSSVAVATHGMIEGISKFINSEGLSRTDESASSTAPERRKLTPPRLAWSVSHDGCGQFSE